MKPQFQADPFRPHAISKADQIPATRYYDPEFFQLEQLRLWPRVWQMACRFEELRDDGDFVEYRLLDQSFIIVRVDRHTIKAYENTCRHRGMRLCEDRGNANKGFNCPFHGWHWSTSGDCVRVFQQSYFNDETIRAADIRLKAVRCEIWGGFVFINQNPDAAPLRESLGTFAPMHEARNVDQLHARFWIAVRVPANWKATLEAFMESYHVSRTHPQLMAALDSPVDDAESAASNGANTAQAVRYASYRNGREVITGNISYLKNLSEGMGHAMVIERDIEVAERIRDIDIPEDPALAGIAWRRALNDAIYQEGLRLGLPMPDLNSLPDELNSPVNYAFPNFFLLPFFGNMASYRVRPLTTETSLMEIWGLEFFPPGAEPPRLTTPKVLEIGDPEIPLIPAQDFVNLPRQQDGMHAAGFDVLRLASSNEGLLSNYQRLIDGYIQGVSEKDLLQGITKVSGPIDAPIKDLGLPMSGL